MELKEQTPNETLQSTPNANEFIIAIGASAGGMEAIHVLFDNTPTDAVSYIIIQHLSPDHKSLMAELLMKHSKLKIFSVEDGMDVLPNCIYVMPEGKNMTIAGGKLVLKDRVGSTPNSAVDIFFNSMAEDLGNKSVAIILSGNGSDGTKGIEAIKRVGGMVIVQDPKSTVHNSMPTHAIESGHYDYILAPNLIPLQIIKYIEQKALMNKFSDSFSEKNEIELLEIISLIKDHTPLDFTDYKRATIVRRITRRMVANDKKTITDYIEFLKSNASEIEILSKEFLISVTNFFRDPEAFEVIANKVIPEIIENKLLVDVLKIWIIGCATGEEAYSLAIVIKEHLINIKKDMEVKIFASDIDKDALAKASKGSYPESIKKSVSEDRLNNFFTKVGNEYRIRDNIRKMIIFAEHDIVHQPPYGKIDLISCRNIMIYFNPTLQKKIFSTINFCLNPDGYLFLGPSEGLGELKNSFSEVSKKWKIYKNLEKSNKANFGSYLPQHLDFKKTPISFDIKPSKSILPNNFLELINRSHLEETGFYAGVCIDENNTVLLPFGDFAKYLLPKLFNNNLLELLPPELSIAAGTSIKKVIRDSEKVTVKYIRYMENNQDRSVKLLVKSFVLENTSIQKAIIIYFGDENIKELEGSVEVFNKDSHTNQYILELEQELAETKNRLQESNASLDESQRNIQSYNEELLSGNEEMQSAIEELQSINEELNTVNSEHQLKIKELAELNDDLNNYFRSTHNTQIYVDGDIILRRFNPITIKQINIKESDIGRPLADISTNIKFTDLIEDIKSVINTQEDKEKHIVTTDGRCYSMNIVPYIKLHDNKTDGAIITFNDITDITESKKVIQAANKKLIKINEDHDTFIYSASHDLKAPLHNMEGLLGLIKTSDNTEEIKSLTVPLIESVIRLKETIDELSDITKIEQEIEVLEKVNLIAILEEIKSSISEIISKATAKISTDLQVDQIDFSKKNLRSILLNLLTNALKYRSSDRQLEISIKTWKENGWIILTFTDNGMGISPDKINEVFTKFSRVHKNETTVEGTGVGLFLVKKIITNADGEIEVESTVGKGSCFTVKFKG